MNKRLKTVEALHRICAEIRLRCHREIYRARPVARDPLEARRLDGAAPADGRKTSQGMERRFRFWKNGFQGAFQAEASPGRRLKSPPPLEKNLAGLLPGKTHAVTGDHAGSNPLLP